VTSGRLGAWCSLAWLTVI